ncbi:nuclear transport factor 2 family protein [Allosphingosinicella indica]|uniref:SnoaL-like domain-containing protein n=1 Tax=Allosphingosinicella indica TaxID=941907 RepID=A0A1X7G0N9_9SPHN|nr:nuclear transport factor 2 family protein [Allosphingosinicella indica]SMF61914.1 SnoaL-like domain-containing protein [Allosphingosinicella indica]
MTDMAPEIRALLDKQEITEVLNRYLRGADRADVELIADAYHPDAIEDHGGVYNGPASDYVAIMAKVLPKGGIMNHLNTNVLIELDGDSAIVESYILAFARMKKEGEKFDTLTLARVVDRFERRDGKWKIALRRLAWEWNHEMPFTESWGRGMMFPEGTELVRGGKKPADVLYEMKAA